MLVPVKHNNSLQRAFDPSSIFTAAKQPSPQKPLESSVKKSPVGTMQGRRRRSENFWSQPEAAIEVVTRVK